MATARGFGADIVLLAGDTFDNHAVTAATIDRAGRALADAGMAVVILPGNHDPATADSIWLRGRLRRNPEPRDPRHHQRSRRAISGARARNLGQRASRLHGHGAAAGSAAAHARRQVALGHGHYEPPETWHNPLRPSWLISDAMIAATGADYLALGHWDRPPRSAAAQYRPIIPGRRITPAPSTSCA